MSKKIDNLYEAVELLARHARCGISSDDTEIMNPEYYKRESRNIRKSTRLLCKLIDGNK